MTSQLVIKLLIVAVLSYLLGSLNFGVILSRIAGKGKDDIRDHGSGNAGTTNMMRSYGKTAGIATIAGDMLKVVVAIVIATKIIEPSLLDDVSFIGGNGKIILKSFAGLFCVIGHIFPCFFNFKGGKGVATSGGMVFMIDWRIALILLAFFAVTVLITKYVSLGSIVMAVLYPVFIFVFYKDVVLTLICVVFTLIVLIAHHENIKRLFNHTESKIGEKKEKSS